MTPQRDKSTQVKRKTSSQPSLISNYFKKVDSSPSQKPQSTVGKTNGQTPPDPPPRESSQAVTDEEDEDEDEEEERVIKRPRLQTPPISDSSRAITPSGE